MAATHYISTHPVVRSLLIAEPGPVIRQYASGTWHDQNGPTVFTNSKCLPGVGFPRNAKPKDGDPIGWNYLRDPQTAAAQRTTHPTGPIERTITYIAPSPNANWGGTTTKSGRKTEHSTVDFLSISAMTFLNSKQ
jgi:hypothetical protein